MKEYVIDLRDICLKGNVLDVSNNNYDIVYSLFKETFQEVSVDYVEENSDLVEVEFYHNVIMFFYLGRLWTNGDRGNIIKGILKNMKPDGELLLWDIDKKYGETFNGKIITLLPNDKKKEIIVKDYNPLKELRKETVERIICPYFDITEQKSWGEIYYIRAKKKGIDLHEDITSRDKFKIHTQQLGGKILKGIHKEAELRLRNFRSDHK